MIKIKYSINDQRNDKDYFCFLKSSMYPYMIVTVSRIPVPDPIARKKSARMVSNPTHIPPKVAAMGIIFLSWSLVPSLVNPFKNIPYDLSCLATSLGP